MLPDKTIIGRGESVNFPSIGLKNIPAKIDTGADSSSIWCSKVKMRDGSLSCVLFAPGSKYYTGDEIVFGASELEVTRVASSFGHKQLRYKVKLPVEIKGRTIRASFTLTDRSTKLYPILIGRSTLQGKFVVDVTKDSPLGKQETARKKRLQSEMKRIKEELDSENSNLI